MLAIEVNHKWDACPGKGNTLLQELALVTHPGNTRKHVLLGEIPVRQNLCPHLSCNTLCGKCYDVVTHIPHA